MALLSKGKHAFFTYLLGITIENFQTIFGVRSSFDETYTKTQFG